MGRAIDMEKDIDKLKAEVNTLKTAFEGLASTVDSLKVAAPARKHVDLHEKSKGTKKVEKKAELITERA